MPCSAPHRVDLDSLDLISSSPTTATSLDPRWVATRLGAVSGMLVGLHVWIHVMHYQVLHIGRSFRRLLDLDAEQSLGTWFAAFLLLLASRVATACSRTTGSGPAVSRTWRLLGMGFLLLSLDEVAGFHESFNSVTEFSWAIPGGLLALAIGICCTRFLRALPRDVSRGLILSGAIYVGGAVGVELAAVPMLHANQLDTLTYDLMTALEEGMEMLGVVAFVYTASRHLARLQSGESVERKAGEHESTAGAAA